MYRERGIAMTEFRRVRDWQFVVDEGGEDCGDMAGGALTGKRSRCIHSFNSVLLYESI